jgi:hypothetical protein
MKSYLLSALILVVLFATWLLRSPDEPSGFNGREAVEEKWKREPQSMSSGTFGVGVSKSQVAKLLPQKTMTAAKYQKDVVAPDQEREEPPFEFRGGAGTGRVVDHEGRVLLESSDERGIFGVSVGPDKKKVLVDAANSNGGNWVVLEPEVNRMIKLPARPSGANRFSLAWHWIGPDLLFGISGVEKVYHEGPHENCCNKNNVAQTTFYTFDLITEELSEVVMPVSVTQPVVDVLEVVSDGHIHLQNETLGEGAPSDLGWFKIDTEE